MSTQPTYRFLQIASLEPEARPVAGPRRHFPWFLGLLVPFLTIAAFLVLLYLTRSDNPLTRLDAAVQTSLGELSPKSPALTAICRMLSALADGKSLAVIGLLGAAGLFCFGWKNRRYFLDLIIWVIGTVVAGLLSFALKTAIQRPRPDQEMALAPAEGWSFPSGHAMGSLVVFGMAAYLLIRAMPRRSARTTAWADVAILVLAIGFSRVYLGAHWLTDVFGGYLAGMGWLAVCLTAFIMVRSGKPNTAPRELPADPDIVQPPESVSQPAAAARPKKPWRRSRKAEGGRLAGEVGSETHVPQDAAAPFSQPL